MRVDTPTETMRVKLDQLPQLRTRQEAEQVEAYFSAVEIPETTPCSRERHKGVHAVWYGANLGGINTASVCQLTGLKQTKEWER